VDPSQNTCTRVLLFFSGTGILKIKKVAGASAPAEWRVL